MRIVKNNKRISVLGLIKFLAAIAIVYYHTDLGGHWNHLWILVELFFFITGYFTFKHFRKKENRGKSSEQKAKNAISYTINKFKPFVTFALIAIILRYIAILLLNNGTPLVSLARIAPIEALLLNSQIGERYWALWYLSAMLIVFPLFCYMCQTKKKRTLYIILFTVTIAYYFNFFKAAIFGYESLIRAFFGMSTGILVYGASEAIRKNKRIKKNSLLLLLISLLSMCASAIVLYPSPSSLGYRTYGELFLIFTVAWFSILMSKKTILSGISSKTMDYLERLSMIIYLIHTPILLIVELVLKSFAPNKITIAAISIVICMALGSLLNEIIKILKSKHVSKNAMIEQR